MEEASQARETAPEDALPTVEQVSPGDVLKGVIRRVDEDLVVVDVGYKADGVVPRSELTLGPGQSPRDMFEEGQEIYVYVLSVDPRDGGLLLSERRARAERAWTDLEEALQTGRIIKAPVIEAVKGGLIVDVGVRAFMPASHVDRGYVSDLSQYVGKNVRSRVLELDRAKGRVILSQKTVLEEEFQRQREATWASLEEGQIRRGVVKGMTDFGAFIDLGGVDGLLHVSELAWGRVDHPSDVLQEGQEVTVKVLRVDRERERVSLSLKQTLPDPWEGVEAAYPVGSWVTGKVVRLVPFGAFVQLQPGVEGLVHISEMAEHHVAKPEDVLAEGQEVQVRVLRVQPDQRRISLSLKPEPQRVAEPAQSGGDGARRGGGKRRSRDRKGGRERERERERVRTEPERQPEGYTLGEVFGHLFEATRQRLVDEAAAQPTGEPGGAPADEQPGPAAEPAAAPAGETAGQAGAQNGQPDAGPAGEAGAEKGQPDAEPAGEAEPEKGEAGEPGEDDAERKDD